MKHRYILNANATDDRQREYKFSIDFFIFKEEAVYIAYCPSLDISTSAKTFNDAISAFYEMFQLHIETCVEMGTLYDDLIEHGWKVNKKTVQPPTVSSMARNKEDLKKLLDSNIPFERISTPARIPSLV